MQPGGPDAPNHLKRITVPVDVKEAANVLAYHFKNEEIEQPIHVLSQMIGR
jgi:hypothetical protein